MRGEAGGLVVPLVPAAVSGWGVLGGGGVDPAVTELYSGGGASCSCCVCAGAGAVMAPGCVPGPGEDGGEEEEDPSVVPSGRRISSSS